MKASALLFLWLSVFFHNSSCSSAVEVNNSATNSASRRTAQNQTAVNAAEQPYPTVESSPSQNPQDVVLFDGTNYIKKSGWTVPTHGDTYVDDTYQLHGKPVENMTENGNKVKTFAKHYSYKTRPKYSEEFNFKGNDLDYMKGPLERSGFFEVRANGKVFMYTVFIEKLLPPPVSNNDHRGDSNQYQIQDRDGDGIFETLLGEYDEIIVPNWVLRKK